MSRDRSVSDERRGRRSPGLDPEVNQVSNTDKTENRENRRAVRNDPPET